MSEQCVRCCAELGRGCWLYPRGPFCDECHFKHQGGREAWAARLAAIRARCEAEEAAVLKWMKESV